MQWVRIRIKVFNVTFNNISVISWRSVLLVEVIGLPGETTNLPQVTDQIHRSTQLFNLVIIVNRINVIKKGLFSYLKRMQMWNGW